MLHIKVNLPGAKSDGRKDNTIECCSEIRFNDHGFKHPARTGTR